MATQKEQIAQLQDRLSEIATKVDDLQAAKSREPAWGEPVPGYSLSDWFPEAYHEPGIIGGIVVDSGLARQTPCRIVPLGDNELWYSKGIVGALNDEQKKLYCETGIENLEITAEIAERQRKVRETAIACQGSVQDIPKGDRLEPFLSCMATDLSEKGIEI